jgi:hypothetical protein
MKIIQKPIVIWWGVDTTFGHGSEEGIRAEEPIPILKKFLTEYAGKNKAGNMMSRCPAILDELYNLYGVKSYYDYHLDIDSNGRVSSPDYDQTFLDNHIIDRSDRCVSFTSGQVFFAPYEKSLLMSQTAASFEDNDIANKTLHIPGRFDIAKYFRTLDHAFIFKKETSSISFLRQQICFNIRFHTTRPIVFRQFFWTKELNEITQAMLATRNHTYSSGSITTLFSYYYKLFDKFQFKKKIIKIIEKNLTKK